MTIDSVVMGFGPTGLRRGSDRYKKALRDSTRATRRAAHRVNRRTTSVSANSHH